MRISDEEMGKMIWSGHPEALKLSREDFVNKGLFYYKTTPEYREAPEENKNWYVVSSRNILIDYYNQVTDYKFKINI